MPGDEPAVYYVVQLTTSYRSVEEAQRLDPELLAEHVARSRELRDRGELLMAGAFMDGDGVLETMAVTPTREAADGFVSGDPFVRAGKVGAHRVRRWANIFARR